MGTTLRAAPIKSYAFSTNYHACIAMPTWSRCAPPILFSPWPPYNLLPRSCLTCIFFVDFHRLVQLCVQHPGKAMPFQQSIMHALQCQHDLDVHLLFCFDLDLHITSSRGCLTWIFFVDPHWWVPLCVQCPSKAMPFQQIIAMPTWSRCASHILYWPCSPYNLFLRSCLIIFFRQSSLMGSTLRAAPS